MSYAVLNGYKTRAIANAWGMDYNQAYKTWAEGLITFCGFRSYLYSQIPRWAIRIIVRRLEA